MSRGKIVLDRQGQAVVGGRGEAQVGGTCQAKNNMFFGLDWGVGGVVWGGGGCQKSDYKKGVDMGSWVPICLNPPQPFSSIPVYISFNNLSRDS